MASSYGTLALHPRTQSHGRTSVAIALVILSVVALASSVLLTSDSEFESPVELALGYSFEKAQEGFLKNDVDAREPCVKGYYEDTNIKVLHQSAKPWADPCLPDRLKRAHKKRIAQYISDATSNKDDLWKEVSSKDDPWPKPAKDTVITISM
eukprot:CAMPEP_0114539572 /NCGR_PEP_ID=MMETSP0114-20121206/307_1 /TAXON_ID=31324 /ORGANISM="Goniomonas sp, Strain m" /LENGTH=151 /DNA_ID=CAMNT_0001723679 /DNA_START=57 /DNA_END=512 /DNA_ORIENTATION=+